MKTNEFLNILKEHPSKELLFEFQPGQLVGANYHITEIKNTHIDSVDCGGRTDEWNETIVQLWESPSEQDKTDYLSTSKATEILNRVHGLNPWTSKLKLNLNMEMLNFIRLSYMCKNIAIYIPNYL